MCNVNPSNFHSETEHLQMVYGIQPVIANPMQTFQCGKCGIQNVIAMPMIQPMQRNPIQYDTRDNCRVSQSQIYPDSHRQDTLSQIKSESWYSGYQAGRSYEHLRNNSRTDPMAGFIAAVIVGAIVIFTFIIVPFIGIVLAA